MTNKYKAIILVIASPTTYYNKNKIILDKFMNSNPNIKTFFIYGNINKETIYKSTHDLFFDCEESLRPGILKKTLLSFEYILKNFEFDYVIRTNISTFWNFSYLLNIINKLPINRCIAGNITNKNFIMGTCIILSKDLIEYIINNKHKVHINIHDDVELTRFYQRELKLKLIYIPRCDIYTKQFPINNIPKKFICYRVKTQYNRHLDSLKMFQLYKIFY
jgi:hypothetical protein